MRSRFAVIVAVAVGVMGLASIASADDVTVSATVTAGTRVITSVPASMSMSSSEAGKVSGSLTVVVTEVAATAPAVNNPWSVTAIMAGNLTRTGGTETIASSNMTLTPNGALTQETNPDPGVSINPGGANQALTAGGTAATLFSVSGEVANTLYNGVYTGVGSIDLTIPSGTVTGTYTGTLTVTLLQ